ncbi:MAG: tetratricopeptide repeat protein [Candidatus Omnitrophica bacterium]|nr:tetratricopeptide repeat protein [Candidatus Omnitrophota bacterium]
MAKYRDVLIICLIAAAGLAVYANSFGNQFVWDDFTFVAENPAIRKLTNFVSFFTRPETLTTSGISKDTYRPLVAASFSVDYFFWKLNPRYYHIESVLFHIINAVLLYFLMRVIIKDATASALVSLLFLAHPVQTEVVDWIARRGDVIGVFCYLLAAIAHFRIRRGRDKKPLLYSGMIMLFAVAVLFKETTITLPLILISADALFPQPSGTRKRSLRYYLPFFAVIVLYMLTRRAVVGPIAQCAWWGGGPFPTFLTMCKVFVNYIRLLIFPMNLCADYVIPVIMSVANAGFLISFFILCAIAAAAFSLRSYSRLFTFGVCWFFISLIPASNIFPIKILLAERFLYIPSIGFFIAVIGLVLKQKDRLKKTLYAAIGILLVIFGVLTAERNKDWKDEITFFTANLKRSPLSVRMRYDLGRRYAQNKMYPEAISEFESAIKLDRYHYRSYLSLGNIYFDRRNYDEALECYTKAESLDPSNYGTPYNIGQVYYKKGDMAGAIKNFKRAVFLAKNSAHLHYSLAVAYYKNRQIEDAVRELGIALRLNPSHRNASSLLKKLKAPPG